MNRSMKLLACGGLLALGLTTAARAQTPIGNGTLFHEFDVGVLGYNNQPTMAARAYLGLYRDMTSGLLLQNVRLWFVDDSASRFGDVYARNVGRDDARYRINLERTGVWRLRFERDETPHLIATDARMLGTISANGDTLSLPNPRPDTAAWNAAPTIGAVGLKTTSNRFRLQVNPMEGMQVRADYDRTTRDGSRPMGMVFAGSSGPTREILEPVNHTLSRFRIAPSLVRPTYQFQASYEYSSFDNAFDAVVADNPTIATSTAAGGSAIGRTALAPANHAHTIAASGGVSLPHSRFTASASYSIRSHDQAFVARTINPMIDTSAFTALPANLGGDVRTSQVNLGWNARVHPKVMLTARFTLFALSDHTPDLSFRGRVVTDRSVNNVLLERETFGYSRRNAVAEASWRFVRFGTLRVSDNWQSWTRNSLTREVPRNSEHTPKIAMDISPLSWLSLRAAYRGGRRTGSNYNNSIVQGGSADLRRYDMADRSTKRFDGSAEVSPLANLSLGLSYGLQKAHYGNGGIGLLQDNNDIVSADLSWTPNPRISLSAGYAHQTYLQLIQSQVRSGAQPNNFSWLWDSRESDVVNSADASMSAAIVPRKLDLGVAWNLIHSTTRLHNWNPIPPTGADSATLAPIRAMDFPDLRYRLAPASAVLRYHWTETWTISARYSTEDFTFNDFRTDGLNPATGGQYYLGNQLQGYGAGYFTISISYRPWVPGLKHSLY